MISKYEGITHFLSVFLRMILTKEFPSFIIYIISEIQP